MKVRIFKNIDEDNQSNTYDIPDKLYYLIKDYLLSICTFTAHDDEGELIDDNI